MMPFTGYPTGAASALEPVPRLRVLAARFESVRKRTEQLAAPLSAEDCALQSMPEASPTKWHQGHTSWFFETFMLARAIPGYVPFHPQFRMLFNSYYVGVGPRHPRPERGLLSRPGLPEVLDYRRHVDREVARLCAKNPVDAAVVDLLELGLQHEEQHQELILTDLKHLLSRNPLRPAYHTLARKASRIAARVEDRWHGLRAGLRDIGHGGTTFCFDNETPRHREYVSAVEIALNPVSNADYLAFIDDGAYERPELWLSDGWEARMALDWHAPLYWSRDGGSWIAYTLHGLEAVQPQEPVCHVSNYEADAYARWSGARLPSEAEWDAFASPYPVRGNFLESGRFHPHAAEAEPDGASQIYGDVWEWTQSAYAPYPGYQPAAGALGEYNGKFMVNQYVLRGGSCATPASHMRPTYRHFFPPASRWQFSGIRLARDAAP